MIRRAQKIWRDHVWRVEHGWELKLDLAEAQHKYHAADHGMSFYVIDDPSDPRLTDLKRDFPRQSRSFRRDLETGCRMLVLCDDTRTMGYFFTSDRDFFDREEFNRTFHVSGGAVYAYNFYVDPAHRTKPVARVLLSEGFAWLNGQNHTALTAICDASNKALVRLYRQFKMFPTGRALDNYKILHRNKSVWVEKHG